MSQPSPQTVTIQQALSVADQHHQAGRLHEAESIYRQILNQHPQHPDALHRLGLIALRVGQHDDASELIRQAIAMSPGVPHYHSNLGMVLAATGKTADAEKSYRQALSLLPDFADAHFNLGNLLRTSNRLDEAIESYRRAMALRPDNHSILLALGNALRENGQIEQAEDVYRQALVVAPDSPPAHFNLGLSLLLQGKLTEAWPHYEWRTRGGELGRILEELPGPSWDGSELGGRRILLQTEQGFGDAIQFVRFVPQVAKRGGKVTLRCRPELLRLFRNVEGIETAVSTDQPLPEYDVHASILSLPLLLGITLESVVPQMPYIRADPELASRWRKRLAGHAGKKIGLNWAGRQAPNPRRSMPLSALAPLAEKAKGATFVSLQRRSADAALSLEAAPFPLLDWTEELHDFADTAALIDNLDLVITIDTAVAHLAGAMGKTAFVLLQRVPDWRWLVDRSETPWYPTAHLFRQITRGDWNPPVQQATEALRALTSQ